MMRRGVSFRLRSATDDRNPFRASWLAPAGRKKRPNAAAASAELARPRRCPESRLPGPAGGGRRAVTHGQLGVRDCAAGWGKLPSFCTCWSWTQGITNDTATRKGSFFLHRVTLPGLTPHSCSRHFTPSFSKVWKRYCARFTTKST